MMLPYDDFDDDFDDDHDDEYDDDFDDDWNGNQAAATLPLQWVTSLAQPLPLASQVNRQYNNDDDTDDDDNDDSDVMLESWAWSWILDRSRSLDRDEPGQEDIVPLSQV